MNSPWTFWTCKRNSCPKLVQFLLLISLHLFMSSYQEDYLTLWLLHAKGLEKRFPKKKNPKEYILQRLDTTHLTLSCF